MPKGRNSANDPKRQVGRPSEAGSALPSMGGLLSSMRGGFGQGPPLKKNDRGVYIAQKTEDKPKRTGFGQGPPLVPNENGRGYRHADAPAAYKGRAGIRVR